MTPRPRHPHPGGSSLILRAALPAVLVLALLASLWPQMTGHRADDDPAMQAVMAMAMAGRAGPSDMMPAKSGPADPDRLDLTLCKMHCIDPPVVQTPAIVAGTGLRPARLPRPGNLLDPPSRAGLPARRPPRAQV